MPRLLYPYIFGVSLLLQTALTAQSRYTYLPSTQDIVNPERGMLSR
mgnify:CR=1 FL=1